MPVNITQHALNFGPPHRNQALFSDHFLDDDQRLKAMSQWRDAEGVDQAFAAIKAVFDSSAVHFGDSTNEDQTEDKFIVPVLKILGWEWETEEHIAHCGGKTPDYALLLSHDDWQAIQPKKGKPEFWASVPALADAKAWPDSLDKKRAGETPTVQISNYLYRSKVRWGILTNGRQWRLYEADKSRAGGIYYEVDLLRLLQGDDDEAFRYFYLFFRRDALVPVGGETFLDLVFRGSAEHAARITDHLKESVYDALRYLMNGFLSHPRNGLDAADPGARALVHDQSLIVLYRLLFILYAEDRDLLPREEDPYKSYSLFQVQRDINVKLRNGTDYNRQVAGLWHSLLDLFQLIDGGLRDEKKPGRWLIPPYNGGLFSVSRFPQIAHSPQPDEPRWEIGDFYLAQVIDMLAYDREQWDQPGAQDLDYATLEVQHLGSIYEGLLELRPELAAVDMIEQPGGQGKGPIVVEAAGLAKPKNVKGQPPRRFATGEVYLATDKGERKATGSYYTPRYIVDYIVENTVGRLCDEAAGQVIAARDKLNAEIAAAKRAAANPNASTPALALPGRLEAQRTSRLLEPYLSLKILDPAMGSGHFLVAAADTLSLAMATDPNLPDAPAPYTDNPQPYYKRLVARHCLYGVDLNWLAVELAKLSLWLHTVQKDTALDFLDHHLRWGNSLIGARIEDDLCHPVPRFNDRGKLATADAGQLVLGFWENLSGRYLGSFLDTLQRIMDEPATDAEAQKKKDRWFREMDRERDRFRQVANLWLAPHFGVAITDDQYQRAVQALHQGAQTDEWRSLAAETWFQDAYAVGGNVHAEKGVEDWRADTEAALRERESVPEPRRFFHWELEFPHAFFAGANWKAKDERGFGAVIGNPPYIRIQNLPATQRQHFGQRYRAAAGDYDIYVLFVDVSIGLTRRGRRVGMIHPHKFVETRYGEGLRRLIVDTAWIAGLLDFGHAQVFDEATTYACVLLLEKGVCGPLPRYARVNASPEAVARAALRPVPMALIEQDPWQIRNAEVYEVMGRLVDPRTATRVGSLCRPHYSLFTGLNEAFIVDEKEARARGLEPALLRPLLKGEHATKWVPSHQGLSIIYPYTKSDRGTPTPVALSEYPNTRDHLLAYREALVARTKFAAKVRDAEEREARWFEFIDPRSPGQFEKPKLLVPEIAASNCFSLDVGGLYCINKIFTLNIEWPVHRLRYLLACLNSCALDFYFRRIGKRLQNDYYEYASSYVAELPIRIIDSEHPGSPETKDQLLRSCHDALVGGDYATPLRLAVQALATHAALHGPAGKPELCEDPYWAAQIADADRDFPGREDFVHDLLADLAQRMMDLTRRRHQLAGDFDADLRGQSGADTAEKLQKGKQERSLYKHEACRPFVSETSGATRSLSESLAWSEAAFEAFLRELVGKVSNLSALLGIYRKYTDEYRQTVDALARTDTLIDRIVYALYGLTDEEIAIVEGTTGGGGE